MPTPKITPPDGLEALPLSAMVSGALVAFTIECEGELELILGGKGATTLFAWLAVMQHVRDGGTSVQDLCDASRLPLRQVEFVVGKLEFWGHLSVTTRSARGGRSTSTADRAVRRQDVSAVRPHSVVELTEKAEAAAGAWPDVIDEVEGRWQRRHGAALTAALKAAARIADHPGLLLPDVVPIAAANHVWAGQRSQLDEGKLQPPPSAAVAALLSRALVALKIAYEERALVPLAVAANTLRVVADAGTPLPELHLRSGTAPETATSQVTVLTKALRFAEVTQGQSRARLLRLTEAGQQAQAAYPTTMADVQATMDPDNKAASAFTKLLGTRHAGELALLDALTPPRGTSRDGGDPTTKKLQAGRGRLNAAAAQTRAFRSDPFNALPHYPVWEQTRGFGP